MDIIFWVLVTGFIGFMIFVVKRVLAANSKNDAVNPGFFDLDGPIPVSIFNCPQCNGTNVAHTGYGFLWQCSDCEYSYDPTAESLSEE